MRFCCTTLVLLIAACSDSPQSSNDAGRDDGATTSDHRPDTPSPPNDALADLLPDATGAEAGADADVDAASVDAGYVGGVAPLPHRTDFLNVGCRTHLYGAFTAAERKACRDAVKKRGYTHFYLYAYNENDYANDYAKQSFDYFSKAAAFTGLLDELIADGLAPVVWLFPDDSSTIHKTSIPDLKAKMTAFVPQIDHRVSSYCLGLELNEYWGEPKVNQLGLHLRSLTEKKIAVHQTDGKWSYGKLGWVDYMILQYGFGETAGFIRDMTKQCIAELNKPVVAGEYALNDEPKGVALGDVAVAGGASGFGNGGTPGP